MQAIAKWENNATHQKNNIKWPGIGLNNAILASDSLQLTFANSFYNNNKKIQKFIQLISYLKWLL